MGFNSAFKGLIDSLKPDSHINYA